MSDGCGGGGSSGGDCGGGFSSSCHTGGGGGFSSSSCDNGGGGFSSGFDTTPTAFGNHFSSSGGDFSRHGISNPHSQRIHHRGSGINGCRVVTIIVVTVIMLIIVGIIIVGTSGYHQSSTDPHHVGYGNSGFDTTSSPWNIKCIVNNGKLTCGAS